MDVIKTLQGVFLVAAISNTVGLVLFKVAAHLKERAVLCGAVKVEVQS